ncbi:MAG: cytochrome c biogenesis protein CcsA [Armatimonadota bacterium]|nr:cytochrome c biogenesis protein CcsA [Armatimonadota bacterium]
MRVALCLAGLGMLALTVLAFHWVPPAQGFRDPGSARIVLFHVPAAFSCTLAFLAGGFFGWRYLRRRQLADDLRAAAANEVGMLFGVLTLLTGMVFASMQWGKPWHWDPRQTSFLLQLMIYAAYFALRGSVEDDRKRAALSSGYAVFAALTVPLLVFVLPRLPMFQEVSLHPSNVMASKQGLDWFYRIGVYLGFVTYWALAFGLYRWRVALAVLEARIDELASRVEHQHAPRVGWSLRVPVVASNADGETSETPART